MHENQNQNESTFGKKEKWRKNEEKTNLDLSEGEKKTLGEFGIQVKKLSSAIEIPACCGQCIHGLLKNYIDDESNKAKTKAALISATRQQMKQESRNADRQKE